MDKRQLVENFFTPEEINHAFKSIWGTMDANGSVPKDEAFDEMVCEFQEPLKRISNYINHLTDNIHDLIATRNRPIIMTGDGFVPVTKSLSDSF